MQPNTYLLAWVWQPFVSPLQIGAGAVVLVGLAVAAYAGSFREHRFVSSSLLVMRLAVIATLTLLLMGPSEIPEQDHQTSRPKLCVLLDTSESMLTADCLGVSRFQFAKDNWLSRELRAELSREYDLELNGFDLEVRPLAAAALSAKDDEIATGRITNLADSVMAALMRLPSGEEAAMLVLSDGRDSQDAPIQSVATMAHSRNVPIYSVALGGNHQQRDLAVLAVPMQEYLLPGEPGAVLVKVYQAGLDQASTTVRMKHGDEEQVAPIRFDGKKVVELQLPVKHVESGQYEHIVQVETVDGEVESRNNQQSVFIEAQKKRMKVLLLEGQPYWDSKFLAQSLRKDDRIELTQITQVSLQKRETIVTRVEGGTPGLPSSAELWAGYDVVILGRSLEHLLDEAAAAQLSHYVAEHGGHVILARGLAYSRDTPEGRSIGKQLSALEPVVWGAGTLTDLPLLLTPSGRASQWFSTTKMGVDVQQAFARLPGFQTMPLVEREKPATVVLARVSPSGAAANGQPALATMSYGRGQVVAILGDGLWRWSLLAPENQDLSGFYDTFWSNLVRWLTMGGDFQPGQQVALQLSRTSARLGDSLTADVVYKHSPPGGAMPKLELTDAQGNTREVALARLAGKEPRYRATFEPTLVGVHRVTLQSPGMTPTRQESRFSVYDVNVERLESSANPMPLRVLAEHSGGLFFEASQFQQLTELLRKQRASMQVPPRLEFVWDRGLLLFVLLLWSGGEWLLRRLAGML